MSQFLSVFVLTTLLSFNAIAESKKCSDGYDNLKHLGGCLGNVLDVSISTLTDLPSNANVWSKKQHNKAKEKLESIKRHICSDVNPVKEVIVEKIVYIDRIKKVPVSAKKRRCTTKKQSDPYGNTNEIITCTEWQ